MLVTQQESPTKRGAKESISLRRDPLYRIKQTKSRNLTDKLKKKIKNQG